MCLTNTYWKLVTSHVPYFGVTDTRILNTFDLIDENVLYSYSAGSGYIKRSKDTVHISRAKSIS